MGEIGELPQGRGSLPLPLQGSFTPPGPPLPSHLLGRKGNAQSIHHGICPSEFANILQTKY